MKKTLFTICTLVLLAWVGLFTGATVGSIIIPKASGIEGPAILFWYSIFGLVVFLSGGVFLMRKFDHLQRKKLLALLLVITILTVTWFIFKINKRPSQSFAIINSNPVQTTQFSLANFTDETNQLSSKPLGLGIAIVAIRKSKPLYFYNNAGLVEDRLPEKILDSLTFSLSGNQLTIATAPEWLFPEYIKIDYGILLFRVTTVTRNRIEVIGNSQTLQHYWINIEDVDFKYWPQFILETNSVEAIDSEKNPVRIKALYNASILSSTRKVPLRPLAIQDEWLQVSTNGLADRIPPSGWIRWKGDNKLMITYSLLE